MKKSFILIAAFAAAMLCSCTKEQLVESAQDGGQPASKGGFPVSVVVGAPAIGDGETSDGETKATGALNAEGTAYKFQWEKGDSIALIAYDPTPKSQAAATPIGNYIMKCGTLYAESSGESVTFSGELDTALASHPNMTKLYAAANAGKITLNWKDTLKSGAAVYTVNGLTIPAVQDGSGFKHSFFLSTDWELNWTGSVPSIKTVGKFTLGNSVLKMNLDSLTTDYDIDSIKFTFYFPKYTGTFAPTGSFNSRTDGVGINGGGSGPNYVTIRRNGGETLSGDVLIAMRRTLNDKKYGVPVARMFFYYKEKGDTINRCAAKKFTLSDDGTYKTSYEVKNGTVHPLPILKSLNSTPKISWTASADAKIVPVDTAKNFTYFPYSGDLRKGSSKAEKMDSTEKADFYALSVDRQYIFKDDSSDLGDTLVIGRLEAGYYYYLTSKYLYTRLTYIEIPAIPGKTLCGVEATTSTKAKGSFTVFNILKAKYYNSKSSSCALSPELYKVYFNGTRPLDCPVLNAKPNTKYYMYFSNLREVTSFKFYYF